MIAPRVSPDAPDAGSASAQARLGQYFTPRWVAEAIVERHFSDLRPGATVLEPSCGSGVFLHALPAHVNAIGVEIDPHWADVARRDTGRTVLVGDFTSVPLPSSVDAVVGNPPFQAATVAAFLKRIHSLLGEGGRCGLILPAYVLQTTTKVLAMAEQWTIQQELMPRNIFPRLSVPIAFTLFTKEAHRRLFGFFLYREAAEVSALAKPAREVLERSRGSGSVWRHAVNEAFVRMSADAAPLEALYAALEGRRPTTNPHFRAKVRQTLQLYPEFSNVDRGVWRRVAPAAAAAA